MGETPSGNKQKATSSPPCLFLCLAGSAVINDQLFRYHNKLGRRNGHIMAISIDRQDIMSGVEERPRKDELSIDSPIISIYIRLLGINYSPTLKYLYKSIGV